MVQLSWFITVTVSLFLAVIGSYAYVHKVTNGIREETKETLDGYQQVMQAFQLDVVQRLSRIEALLNKGHGRRE